MTTEQIQARLSAIRAFDFGAAEMLARDILKDARVPLHALHRSLAFPEHPSAEKAHAILHSLGELAILPWLVVTRKWPAERQTQPLYEAYRAHEAFGQKIEQVLRGMLSQRNLVPPAALGEAVEMQPRPTRECDEAYLMLLRLAQPDEPEPERQQRRTAFLVLPEDQRDQKIREFQAT